ncbi:hypothetical protein B0T24DRAFT_274046 [Lasiosphaeria ovina]|uniref:Uncharacterized protein n=1 Tax=Lasiosphaeria ovina TaxID=92902 RepID=A0AAE0N7N5_9PEZI|nr:hypothetical protein B0T24DRAFT_274046 [Lasiosphaeria ovina]
MEGASSAASGGEILIEMGKVPCFSGCLLVCLPGCLWFPRAAQSWVSQSAAKVLPTLGSSALGLAAILDRVETSRDGVYVRVSVRGAAGVCRVTHMETRQAGLAGLLLPGSGIARRNSSIGPAPHNPFSQMRPTPSPKGLSASTKDNACGAALAMQIDGWVVVRIDGGQSALIHKAAKTENKPAVGCRPNRDTECIPRREKEKMTRDRGLICGFFLWSSEQTSLAST